MATTFNTPLPKTENYIFGRGVGYFAEFDDNGDPMGERDLGNLPGVTLTVTSTDYKHTSSRTGLAKTDLSVTLSVEFSAKLDFEDFSAENLALFIAGQSGVVTQSSTPVTGEIIPNGQSGREYQLGATPNNPSGVRGVSSVAINSAATTTAATRANSTAYAVGALLKSSTNLFVVTVAGTSASSAPSFVTTNIGDTTSDGTATLTYIGTTTAYTVTTDYTVSALAGRIAIVPGGAIAKAAAVMPAGFGFDLSAAYTPTANTRQQIKSSGSGSVSGQFRFISDNATGNNQDFFIPSCTLSASGDLPFISDNAVAKASFDLGVNEKDSSTPQVIIDGRPAT